MFERNDNTPSKINDELKLIPRWSVASAAVAFVLVQYLWYFKMPHPHNHPPPLGMRVYFALSWSALVSLYVLMVGYISKDAPRRNMNKGLWMVLSIILQAGIGPVLYFLLRQPVVSRCPSCNTRIESGYHFCPQCAYQVSAACGSCHMTVGITDVYCTRCGHALATDNTPARLKAYQD